MTKNSRSFFLLSQVFFAALYLTVGIVLFAYLFASGKNPRTFCVLIFVAYAACLIVAIKKWFNLLETGRRSNFANLASILLWALPVLFLVYRIWMILLAKSDGGSGFNFVGGTIHLAIWFGASLICSILLAIGDWTANKTDLVQ